MKRKPWLNLTPSLLVGAGILLSSLVAVRATHYGWWVLAGPLLLALAVVSADVLGSRLRGESSAPSPAALLLGGSFLLASWIVALRDPGLVKSLLPILGAASGVTLLRPAGGRKPCRSLNLNR
jgi:hypothetical protein